MNSYDETAASTHARTHTPNWA